uniref:ATP synthase F0 subunit 8 n=1 Tax=Arion vulgaris TaxID=1028688 RepID=A0A6C0AA76_9EUPU|nr:ATP synthase F0 subunit 8 [Arion vulgaris]QHS71054.1 ATP synthase F0 subunit 8 [Arion vulgaris]
MPQLSPSPVLLIFSMTVMLLFVSCISFQSSYKIFTQKEKASLINKAIMFKCLGGSEMPKL